MFLFLIVLVYINFTFVVYFFEDKKLAKQNTKDLTVGSPTKLILGFLVPLLFGLLFQQVYNLVDTVIVGKYLGVTALAGVGATGSINFLILGFCNGTCSGFSIPVAQQYGAKDFKAFKETDVIKYAFQLLVINIAFYYFLVEVIKARHQ